MYLFFFAVLFIIFQYANEKAIFGKQDSRIVKLSEKLTKAKDSLSAMAKQTEEANYFTLQANDNAMSYIERLGMEAEEVQQLVSDKIYDQNGTPGGNPIITLKGVHGDFKINKIKFLNHRWIQADFSDGKNWGEAVSSGEFSNIRNSPILQTKTFELMEARYIRLVAEREINDGTFASIAELGVITNKGL